MVMMTMTMIIHTAQTKDEEKSRLNLTSIFAREIEDENEWNGDEQQQK
jgi:hypothetical protein